MNNFIVGISLLPVSIAIGVVLGFIAKRHDEKTK